MLFCVAGPQHGIFLMLRVDFAGTYECHVSLDVIQEYFLVTNSTNFISKAILANILSHPDANAKLIDVVYSKSAK